MKRYLLGSFAIILAIAFSSFTNSVKSKTLQQFGFWYYTNGSLVGSAIYENSSTPIDKQSGTITSATDCEDNVDDPCVIGYASQLTPGNAIPGNVTRDGQVLRTTH